MGSPVAHCVVVGAGPMGVATARALATDPVTVTLVDRDSARLDAAGPVLGPRVRLVHGDAASGPARELVRGADVVAAALSWVQCGPLFDLAAEAPVRLAGIGRPPADPRRELAGRLHPGSCFVPGAGLEPGLTEILARRLVATGGGTDAVRVYCGGVPTHPRPPVRHLSWYGPRLTVDQRPTFRVAGGRLCAVPRFSGVELVDVPGVGRLEAYHDGMLPWLRDDPVLGGVASLDQKTLRWPGYAGTIRLLTDLGLLGEDPVATADGMVRPRAVLDAVLAPHVTPRAGETEVTVLAVVAGGERCTSVVAGTADGTSGMGRLTGGVLAAAARLLADGSVGAGVVHAHEALHGERAEALLDRLRGDAVSVVDHRGGWLSRVSDDVGEDPDE